MTTPKRKRAPGGGRKRTANGVKVAVTLGREHLDYLAALGGTRSAALRRVIEEHRKLATMPVKAIQTLYHVAFGSSVRPRINDTLNTVGAWLDSLETVDAAMTESEVFAKLAELVPSLNSRQPKPGYVWAMMWYPGGRKELVEVLPEQVDPLDTALHRLANNHKAYVALGDVVAVARRGW